MATLVERHTRYLMRAKVASKDTETVIDALIKQAQKLPREVYTFLTWDRGQEMADHTRFTLGIDIQIYVGDPHHPWQQEANEHTHGLLRQCFPKGMDVSTITQAELNAVVRRLNERPRTTLHVETPAERVNQCIAGTAMSELD